MTVPRVPDGHGGFAVVPFLQLDGLRPDGTPRKFVSGTAPMTWPGDGTYSNPSIVDHGLGVTPVWWSVFGSGLAPGPVPWYAWAQVAPTSTQIIFYGFPLNGLSVPAGAGGTAWWAAIG